MPISYTLKAGERMLYMITFVVKYNQVDCKRNYDIIEAETPDDAVRKLKEKMRLVRRLYEGLYKPSIMRIRAFKYEVLKEEN